MKTRQWVGGTLLATLVSTLQLAACASKEVPLEEEPNAEDEMSGMAGSPGAINTAPTKGGSCTFREGPTSSYGYCSSPAGLFPLGDYPMNCPVYDEQSGAHGWGLSELEDTCGACRCNVQCESDDDCPSPDGGTVTPICVDENCELPCDDGETCPDGMRCVPHHDEGDFCAWVADAESSFTCWLDLQTPGPGADQDGCAEFTTKESCEARLEADPYQPQVACVWAKESIYSTIDDSCEVLSEEEHCIVAEAYGQREEEEVTNRCGGASVFWSDLGPQTAALMVIEQCGYRPWLEFSPCELGDPSIPLLCNCGCE